VIKAKRWFAPPAVACPVVNLTTGKVDFACARLDQLAEAWRRQLVSHRFGHDPRLIFTTVRENGPGDAGKLVGERDSPVSRWSRFNACSIQGRRPRIAATHQNDVCGLHEQRPQVLVAALGYFAQDRAISRRLLLWHEAESGTEVASLLEACAIADRCYHGTRDDRADARHSHQALAAVILLRLSFDLGLHALNSPARVANHSTKFVGQVMHLTHTRSETVSNSQEASARLLREADDDIPV
jgi:hypothetical protein